MLAFVAAVAAACVAIGLYTDFSWHMSIGRDTFWTPAHMLIQAGGLLAGVSAGFVALRTTFAGAAADRDASVSVWGFRAPLGAWICIWGAAAMLTSGPLDEWWHRSYGLDVTILSVPHAVLAAGMLAVIAGSIALALARQNRADGAARRGDAWLVVVTNATLLVLVNLLLTESSLPWLMHAARYYAVIAAIYAFLLTAMARSTARPFGATTSAAVFMAVTLVLMWAIQVIPAAPRLAPITHPITHMVGLAFPLLLVVPAIAVDLVVRRSGEGLRPVPAAGLIGVGFVASFVAVQWPFATFLVTSPAARNPLFNADNFMYNATPEYMAAAHTFGAGLVGGALPMLFKLVVVAGIGAVAGAAGLRCGGWMQRVRR